MNDADLKELKMLIVAVAEYYGRELKPSAVSMMADDLQDLPLMKVLEAYGKYRREDKLNRFPQPAVIRELVLGPVSDESLAVEAAARIVAAISRFGWNNTASAREYVGELGWAVVMKQGGWVDLCENLRTNQIQTFQAQAREIAKAQISLAKAGMLDKPPALPAPAAASGASKALPAPKGGAQDFDAAPSASEPKTGMFRIGDLLRGEKT